MKPIDYVVPMVFPTEKGWQDKWCERFNEPASSINITPRWRSFGTEQHLVRCILKFLPWVRCIHILLADEEQVQPWMKEYTKDKDSKVRLVFHRDFIPEEYLPCFNSSSIEMFLHRIPKLAEQFIYGNDDIYPIAPMAPEDFFRNGVPCQHHDVMPYKKNPYILNIFMGTVMTGLNMVASDFGQSFDDSFLYGGHITSSLLRSTCKTLFGKHKDEILASIHPSRSEHEMNQYIYSFYQHLSGKYVDHQPRRRYLNMGNTLDEIREAFLNEGNQIVCVNDSDEWTTDWKKCAELVAECLEARLND